MSGGIFAGRRYREEVLRHSIVEIAEPAVEKAKQELRLCAHAGGSEREEQGGSSRSLPIPDSRLHVGLGRPLDPECCCQHSYLDL